MLQSFFNKVAGLRAFGFIKKKFQGSCFPVKFAKFLRTPTFKNICERLLLYLHVILFTVHEKDLHEKIQLAMREQNPLQHINCNGFFFRKHLTTYYFHKKVLSSIFDMVLNAEGVTQRRFVNKVVLQISENSQEKTCNRVS